MLLKTLARTLNIHTYVYTSATLCFSSNFSSPFCLKHFTVPRVARYFLSIKKEQLFLFSFFISFSFVENVLLFYFCFKFEYENTYL
jgi:hypothetical protein